MRTVYNQKNVSLTIAGVPIQDFAEGTTIVYTKDGGELQKTQGTDGAGINIATRQGPSLTFTLRETSRSRAYINGISLAQYEGAGGVPVVLRTGAQVLHILDDAYVGQEGELSSGDKTQGPIQYMCISANENTSNLDIVTMV